MPVSCVSISLCLSNLDAFFTCLYVSRFPLQEWSIPSSSILIFVFFIYFLVIDKKIKNKEKDWTKAY